MTTPAEMVAAKKKWRKPSGRVSESKRYNVWQCTLKEKREALRLSMRDVANGVKMSLTGYYAVERGSDPMLTTAVRLCAFFGCGMQDLWPKLKPIK